MSKQSNADTQRAYSNRAKYAAQRKWHAEHPLRRVVIVIGEQDADMIAHIDGKPNASGYIKSLIRADMDRAAEL